jgi:two-component system sensor histidine kinase PilS (NtrC family)
LLFQDVTKVRHLEERLKQNEKLAAVGQLAAGIAHEIRNPLASMSASIEMLKGALPPSSEFVENQRLMDIAIREIDRLNDLITEFLDFVKPEKFKLESIELGTLVEDVVKAVQSGKYATNPIEWVSSFSPGILVQAHREKMKQVVWNLVLNAVQAFQKPGKIEVGVAIVNDHWAKLYVKDDGQGMSEEVQAHLYEPFFTTKDKGTGLGLATVYKIVEGHYGEIRVQSRPGAGTLFEVFLPRG